jgi:thiol-disulfide isomerase/thioredoxin
MSGGSGRGVVFAVVATTLLWLLAVVGAGAFWWLSQRRAVPSSMVLVPASAPGEPMPQPFAFDPHDVPVEPPAPSGPLPIVPPVPPAGGALSRTSVEPVQGHLDEVLRAELAASETSGRRLLVFFTAPWCVPCQAVKQTLAAPDVSAQLADVQLVEVDIDAFSGLELHRAAALLLDQEVEAIPLVCALRSRQPPVCMDGGAWGEDSDANIRSTLVPFMVSPPSGVAPRAPDRITPI